MGVCGDYDNQKDDKYDKDESFPFSAEYLDDDKDDGDDDGDDDNATFCSVIDLNAGDGGNDVNFDEDDDDDE